MTERTKSDLAWVRSELAKNPDRERYNVLKNNETAILKRRFNEDFDEASARTHKYAVFKEATMMARRIGYQPISVFDKNYSSAKRFRSKKNVKA